jgi:hypothetical protein
VPGGSAILGGLTVADVQTVTGSGSGTLRISGDVNDSVELASGAWTTNNTVTNGYVAYTSIPTGTILMIQDVVAVSYVA